MAFNERRRMAINQDSPECSTAALISMQSIPSDGLPFIARQMRDTMNQYNYCCSEEQMSTLRLPAVRRLYILQQQKGTMTPFACCWLVMRMYMLEPTPEQRPTCLRVGIRKSLMRCSLRARRANDAAALQRQ